MATAIMNHVMLRSAFAVLLSLAFIAPSAWAGEVLNRIKKSGHIVIAYRESSVPFSYVGSDKKPIGYAIDLCLKVTEAVRKKLELKVLVPEFTMVSSATRISTVVDGRADLECGSTTNNAERRRVVAFTVPHHITGARYMVRADSTISDLADFEHKKLVSTKGSTPLKAIQQVKRERLMSIGIVEANDHARAVEMVKTGEVDGFVMDEVLLYGLIAVDETPAKLKVVGKYLTIEPLAIMLPKGDPEFKSIVDEEMKRLIRTQEAYAIYDRWFLRPIPPKNTALNLRMSYLLKDFWKYPTDQVPY